MEICQSCGMPMSKADDFGTEKDGNRSGEYCRFCYADGKFLDDGITMEKKIAKNIEMAMMHGIRESEAKRMANSVIPRLNRWRKK